jgi:hypothetical protein
VISFVNPPRIPDDAHSHSCASAHSQPLNANMKAYAAWWLFVQIAAGI